MRKKMICVQSYLSNQLEMFRTKNHMSQEEMAECLYIAPRSYFDLENNTFLLSTMTLIFFHAVVIKPWRIGFMRRTQRCRARRLEKYGKLNVGSKKNLAR